MNNLIDLNETKVFISIELKYQNTLTTIELLLRLLEQYYSNIEKWNKEYSRKTDSTIDINVLKYFIDKLNKSYEDTAEVSYYVKLGMEEYKKHYNIDGVLAWPVKARAAFEVTLNELITVYRVLEYCKEYYERFSAGFYTGKLSYYFSFIDEFQKELESRLNYRLLKSKI